MTDLLRSHRRPQPFGLPMRLSELLRGTLRPLGLVPLVDSLLPSATTHRFISASSLPALAALALASPAAGQSFGAQQVITTSAYSASSVYATDLDGDGDADVLSTDDLGLARIAWYENQGSGAFGAAQTLQPMPWSPTVVPVYATDLDGDGDADVLSCDQFYVYWWENLGGGVFANWQYISTSLDLATSLYATDLDGDGDADVLSASDLDNKIAWYENLGGGAFGAQQVIATSAIGANSVYATDLDRDGDADVLRASSQDDEITWYENQGGGVFGAQQVITTSANGAFSVYATDLDGDGDADVLSASYNDDKIAWYENLGGGVFGAQQVITTSANGAFSVYATDLDRDGDADVLSASRLDNKIAWYENLGGGAFGAQQVISTNANGASAVYATDLDGDGDADVLSASSQDDKIAWYENLTFTDCNGNGVNDPVDINSGASGDCNANGIPDECEIAGGDELDCNGNGIPDSCELATGTELDCNLNSIPDSCELTDPSRDLNLSGVPDDCESIGARYCTASANSSGLPGELTVIGSDLLSQNDVMLTARQLPLQSFGFFITSQTPASINPVTNSQGTLCVTGSVGRYVGPGQIVNSGTIGAVALPIDLAAMPTPTGLVTASMFSTWYFQLWYRDANPTLTSNFTDAVAVTFL